MWELQNIEWYNHPRTFHSYSETGKEWLYAA